MKITNWNRLLIGGLCALGLSFGTTLYAEKGSETLLKLSNPPVPAKTVPAVSTAHKCLTCTDSIVSKPANTTKGANPPAIRVVRHNCKGCDTTINTAGVGKAKYNVVTHTCNGEIKPVCCAAN